jgi:phage tail-like protein
MADNIKYPMPKFHFRVEWNKAKFGFTEVSGLDINDQKEPPQKKKKKIKMPGMQKFGNITMKRGVFMRKTKPGVITFTKSDLIIRLIDEKGTTVYTWKLQNAWPVKIQSTDLKGKGNEVAIETIEFAHEGLCLVDC